MTKSEKRLAQVRKEREQLRLLNLASALKKCSNLETDPDKKKEYLESFWEVKAELDFLCQTEDAQRAIDNYIERQ